MSDQVHVLVVRAAGASWALPMDRVEQAFSLRGRRIHNVAGVPLLIFRGQSLEVLELASALGQPADGAQDAAVIVWAGGRRQAFGVQELAGQLVLDRSPLPAFVRSRFCSGAVLDRDEIIPVLEPGVVAGAWDSEGDRSFGFTAIQQSALLEIANIGSGNAATALSQMLGKPVEVHYAEALLATLAEAADRAGASASLSAVVDTPVAGDGGKVLLLFPDGAGDQLCELFGTSLRDEMGRSTLREVGNILASSYLNAIVEMTGMALEPEPPTIEIDLLGNLVQKGLAGIARPTDATVLMRSCMTVESSDARFAFLFVPHLGAVHTLLDRLGVGSEKAA